MFYVLGCAKSLPLCTTLCNPVNVAHKAPLSMELSRQEYWAGCQALLQGIFPKQGWNPPLLSSAVAGGFYHSYQLANRKTEADLIIHNRGYLILEIGYLGNCLRSPNILRLQFPIREDNVTWLPEPESLCGIWKPSELDQKMLESLS